MSLAALIALAGGVWGLVAAALAFLLGRIIGYRAAHYPPVKPTPPLHLPSERDGVRRKGV